MLLEEQQIVRKFSRKVKYTCRGLLVPVYLKVPITIKLCFLGTSWFYLNLSTLNNRVFSTCSLVLNLLKLKKKI